MPEPDCYGQVAQLVEQRTENPCVGGSNPLLPIFNLLTDSRLRLPVFYVTLLRECVPHVCQILTESFVRGLPYTMDQVISHAKVILVCCLEICLNRHSSLNRYNYQSGRSRGWWFKVPLTDASAGLSCLATYLAQGILGCIEFILGGPIVDIQHF